MRYLITGGAGFIGSHLCELLLAQVAELAHVLGREPTLGDLGPVRRR